VTGPDMAPDPIDERRARGLRVLGRLSGEQAPSVEAVGAQMGQPIAEAVVDFAMGDLWERPHLDLKTRSFIVVAALTALGDPRALEAHIRGALAHGASQDELREVFLLLAGYAGFPRATAAAVLAEEVFRN
jgi:4-carboxymuconolactone decarboxylase